MHNAPNVFDVMKTGANIWRLGFETNNVIFLRMMGMAGVWNTPFDENWRMVAEKPHEFIKSGRNGVLAAMAGKPATQVVDASLRPLNRATSANRKRLSKRGPRKIG
ncbi:antifreeze protein [Tropicimonas sp. S265A]|uniref:antifreeze protein n=1 Tax=Tropicimonas sp. S265A TaxID=3415134 RepID=UPI003C7DA5FE